MRCFVPQHDKRAKQGSKVASDFSQLGEMLDKGYGQTRSNGLILTSVQHKLVEPCGG